MKIAIISDTHFGLKANSDIFLDYQERFFRDLFFPYLLENGITRILHMGDYFDNRKNVGVKTLHRSRKCFLDKVREHGMHMDIIPGNHDVVFKNTNDMCSLKEVLGYYTDCVTIHMDATILDFDGCRMQLLPWITKDNYEASVEIVKNSPAPILVGHLELGGFEMMRGVLSHESDEGLKASDFGRYEYVFTGHYHTKNSKGNIHYFGTQFEQTWADADDPKFFHIFDTAARDITAVHNPERLFIRIFYDDDASDPMAQIDEMSEVLGDTFLKVIVKKRTDNFLFDKFIERLNRLDPLDLKVVEYFDEFAGENVTMTEEHGGEDTQTLLNMYVDSLKTDLNVPRLKQLTSELLIEAQTIEL